LNLFWLFWILRIAYRFVFMDELSDDRSDDDEVEFAEEQRLDAIDNQNSGGDADRKVLSEEKSSTDLLETVASAKRKDL